MQPLFATIVNGFTRNFAAGSEQPGKERQESADQAAQQDVRGISARRDGGKERDRQENAQNGHGPLSLLRIACPCARTAMRGELQSGKKMV